MPFSSCSRVYFFPSRVKENEVGNVGFLCSDWRTNFKMLWETSDAIFISYGVISSFSASDLKKKLKRASSFIINSSFGDRFNFDMILRTFLRSPFFIASIKISLSLTFSSDIIKILMIFMS